MSGPLLTTWRLRWKGPFPGGPRAWVDGAPLQPGRLAPLTLEQVLATPARAGSRSCVLGDLFTVTEAGAAEEPTLIVEGSPRLVRLGHGMAAGRLEVEGHGGELCGSGLAGGTIFVQGDVGAGAGCGMTGGLLTVEGNAGDHAGGAAGNAAAGLRGGEIVIRGDAASGAGFRMRRGLLAIAGRVGPLAGHAMLAGTLVLGTGDLRHPGAHLRRGSIVALAPGLEPAPGFRREGPVRPGWLQLLRARLDALAFPWPPASRQRLAAGRFLAWSGDELFGSRGEVLAPMEDA